MGKHRIKVIQKIEDPNNRKVWLEFEVIEDYIKVILLQLGNLLQKEKRSIEEGNGTILFM